MSAPKLTTTATPLARTRKPGALLAILLAGFASTASAQFAAPCGTADLEILLTVAEDGVGRARVTVTDLESSTVVYDDWVLASADLLRDCDWVANLGGDPSGIEGAIELSDTTLYRIDIGSQSYTYFACEEGYDTYTEGFYCPNGGDGNQADLYFIYDPDNGLTSVAVYVEAIASLTGVGAVNDHFSDSNWIVPYNLDVVCAGAEDPGGEDSCLAAAANVSFFVTPQLGPSFALTPEDITLPSGKTWYWGGIEVKFATSKKLKIYGAINADSMAFAGSSGSWAGIVFNSGSSGTISYTDISGAGITVSNADVAIDHSTLSGSGYTAISVTGSSAEVDVSWTDISGYGDGISFTSTAFGHVWRSNIDATGNAVTTSYYAHPYIGAYPYNNGGNNKLVGDQRTVAGWYGSTIWGGSSGYNGNNYICDGASIYDAVEDASSTVTLVGNYWPSNPPDNNSPGVDDANPLGTSGASCPPIAGKGLSLAVDGQSGAVDGRLPEASELMSEAADTDAGPEDSRFQRAAALLKEVQTEHAGTSDAVAALVALFRLSRLQGTEEQRPYFEGLAMETGPDQADALGILIQAYRHWGDTGRARETASALSERFADQWHAFYAQLSLFEMDLEAGDYAGAATTLGGMEARDEFEAARLLAAWNELERLSGEAHSYDVSPRASDGASEDTDQTVQPLTLVEAYPNPFNPEVVIAFELSRETDVRITMFDAVGRVVGRLADRPFGAGRHRVDWNAAGMASGSYFAVVRAGGAARTLPILHQK
jgi:hypothetical protein